MAGGVTPPMPWSLKNAPTPAGPDTEPTDGQKKVWHSGRPTPFVPSANGRGAPSGRKSLITLYPPSFAVTRGIGVTGNHYARGVICPRVQAIEKWLKSGGKRIINTHDGGRGVLIAFRHSPWSTLPISYCACKLTEKYQEVITINSIPPCKKFPLYHPSTPASCEVRRGLYLPVFTSVYWHIWHFLRKVG